MEMAAERLSQLRFLGVRAALDDFGTAASSLTHLRRLPMDLVKIGRSFVEEEPGAPGRTGPLIDGIVELGRRFGIEIVAQGLEKPEQLALARRAGCQFGQGHLLVRPQPAERTEAYLDSFRARSG
jgi:EAL domain-containing protein (putative c-di-GMP-specific phosphodiesterase class I)